MILSRLRQGHIYQPPRLKPKSKRTYRACPIRRPSSVWISLTAPSRGMSLLPRRPRSPHRNPCSPYRVPSQALLRPLPLRSSARATRFTTLTSQPPPSSPPRVANRPKPQPQRQQHLPARQDQVISPSAQTPPSLSKRPLQRRTRTTNLPASPAPTAHAPSALSDPAASPHT